MPKKSKPKMEEVFCSVCSMVFKIPSVELQDQYAQIFQLICPECADVGDDIPEEDDA